MNELLYKVGDVVRVRPDLENYARYKMIYGPLNVDGELTSDTVVDEMMEFAGKDITIEQIQTTRKNGKEYKSKGWFWVDTMFDLSGECFCESLL